MAATPSFKAPVPRMHIFTTSTGNASVSSASLTEWEPSPRRGAYATPSNRRVVPNFTRDDTEEAESDRLIDPKYAFLITQTEIYADIHIRRLDAPWKPDALDEKWVFII